MAKQIVERMGDVVIFSYTARSGATRFCYVTDAGSGEYHTPSAQPGCHTYYSRRFDDAASYAIAHSPGVNTYASRAGCRRALRRIAA